MVERIAAAVREDGVPVGAILALTFTEKAAGELAERLRRRLTELGEDEHARAVDGAWIGTIHGFCARLLRAQPLAAGLDPRFEVLERAAAERLAEAAYERALEAWARAHGAARDRPRRLLRPGPARARPRRLRDACAPAAHARPRLAIPPPRAGARPAPRWPPPARPRVARLASSPATGVRVTARARDALAACRERWRAPARRGVPWPGALDAAELKGGAKALDLRRRARPTATAWARVPGGLRRPPRRARRSRCSTRCSTASARRTTAAKAERAAVDFEDLELRARDLLADPATRARWAERFALIMIDEFQDTNAVQLEHPARRSSATTCSRSATSSSRSTASGTPT